MKILRTDSQLEMPLTDAQLRAWGHEVVLVPEGIPRERLLESVRDIDALLMCYTPIPAEVIAAAPRLKGIVKYGVGIDAIDIPAAHARGIPVVNIPTYAEETVAEGAFAHLIALAKRIPEMHLAMRNEEWLWPESRWLGSDLAGKTLGIVGCGKIGRSMARMAGKGFRMRVVAYDPGADSDALAESGVELLDSLHAVLEVADAVSLHAVLRPSTIRLIGAAELAAMKPGAILINSARGALVDEQALLDSLRSGHLGGAGLDVFSREPLNRTDHPLRDLYEMDNVILTPHLTFYTREAMTRLEKETLERCAEVLEGRPVTLRSDDPRLRPVQEAGTPH